LRCCCNTAQINWEAALVKGAKAVIRDQSGGLFDEDDDDDETHWRGEPEEEDDGDDEQEEREEEKKVRSHLTLKSKTFQGLN
jgi:hypothetical protein